MKMNSLVDPEIIDALYRASQAGVEVDLVVRGICCLRPKVRGFSENIRVKSIVGRFWNTAHLLLCQWSSRCPRKSAGLYRLGRHDAAQSRSPRGNAGAAVNPTVHELVLSQIMLGNLIDNQPELRDIARWNLQAHGCSTR